MSFKEIINLSKRVAFNYIILKRYEAGISLFGWEVCSVRLNSFGLLGSYLKIKNMECFLIKSLIKFNVLDVESKSFDIRDRKLLLHKREIISFIDFLKTKTHTIVPSKAYWKNNYIKLELCFCIGKKKYDKRMTQKNKEWNLDKLKILKDNSIDY